ncbi:MAG: histone deacetylase [Spirochaetaceae bacterium]|jgi:acetoin utilization deacetylase AcuC-like enzyme|nr:histone deacetylase [Spirochaetaceae bacterium]
MILNDPCQDSSWLDYGVTIPFPVARPRKILDFLGGRSNDFPGPVIELNDAVRLLGKDASWIIDKNDIERVHKKEYAGVLFGDQGDQAQANALLDIYELIDKHGNPKRYNKNLAKKSLKDLFDRVIINRLYGTYIAVQLALQDKSGFCYYLAGGNHHARYDWGAGFCVFNDMIFAARKLQADGQAKLIWLIDVDAHKGCGSAEIVEFIRTGKTGHPFEKDCDILTLSAHMARGWPLDDEVLSEAKPERAPFISSDIDIPIESGEESLYCAKLEAGLRRLELLSAKRGRRLKDALCDFAIVVDGSDPYEADGLESSSLLQLTLEQCLERDRLIFRFLREREIKSAWVLAGGYGERAWEPHAQFLLSLSRQLAEIRLNESASLFTPKL